MPTQDFGLYPDGLTAGTQVSSTDEGRYITLYESEIVHPNHGTGFPVKGDPIVYGTVAGNHGVGVIVAITGIIGAPAVTDLIVIDTEGLWNLSVVATDDAGASLVTGGDLLYVNTTTCVISKISNQATQIPFGLAMGQVAAGATAVIAVRAHYDPSMDNAKRTYMTVADGAYVYGKHHTAIFEGGQSTGLEYFDQQVDGVQDGELYGLSSWMELASGFSITGGQTVVGELGIYDAGGTLTNMRLVMLQLQAILASNPGTSLHIFRINVAAAGGAITAIYAAANPTSLNFQAVVTEGDAPIGYIPFATIVGINGGNPVMIRVYADTD